MALSTLDQYIRPPATQLHLECHVLDTGYCLASEHHMMRGGRHQEVACHSIVALIHHPVQGWCLWDTGYAPRLLEATRSWPYRIYRLLTPLRLRSDLAVINQLARLKLKPGNISHVIISHFHADHIAGLRDFPSAHLIALQAAYADVATRRGWRALLRAFIPALLPDDFAHRATLLPNFSGPPLPGLGPTYDLFGDGSLQLVQLPGHACGQIGLLVHTSRGPLLFAADGAWLTQAIRECRPPARLTNLIVDNAQAVRTTLEKLHIFMQACPDVRIVPSHCPEAFAREVRN